MQHLVTDANREPIAETAKRIGRSVGATIRLCRNGLLAHQKDRCGYYWSSADAARDFMGTVTGGSAVSEVVDWESKMWESLPGKRPARGTARGTNERKSLCGKDGRYAN